MYIGLNEKPGVKRGDKVARMAARLERFASGDGPLNADELEQFIVERGYRWQTLDIVLSLLDNGNRYVLALNVPNEGYVTNLRKGSIVEIPAIVGADRIYGLGMGELPPAIASLMERQLATDKGNLNRFPSRPGRGCD